MNWEEAQKWELDWHLNNRFIYREELKQEVYAEKMGLNIDYPDYNLGDKKIIDIGGGECSMLLKFIGGVNKTVVDPLMSQYPRWIIQRYDDSMISSFREKAESLVPNLGDITNKKFDEAWIYNVLQHTEDPKKIIENAKKLAKTIRIFEWIETPITDGHIHTLHAGELNEWLGGEGQIGTVQEKGCYGLCYYGVFI